MFGEKQGLRVEWLGRQLQVLFIMVVAKAYRLWDITWL